MATVIKEMAVAVATYEDRSTGQQKNRYKNIGVLMESSNQDGSTNQFLLLDRSFNPAGVPVKQGSDKIIVSLFDPRDEKDRGRQNSGGSNQGGGHSGNDGGHGGSSDLDDSEIPF